MSSVLKGPDGTESGTSHVTNVGFSEKKAASVSEPMQKTGAFKSRPAKITKMKGLPWPADVAFEMVAGSERPKGFSIAEYD